MERETNLTGKAIVQHFNSLHTFSVFTPPRGNYFPRWEKLLHELGVIFIETTNEEEALLIEAQFEIFLRMDSEALRTAGYAFLTHPLLRRDLSDRAVHAIATFRVKQENKGIIMQVQDQQRQYLETC